MKILFIAFEFPPLGGAGVQRSIKFAKYLGEFGIEPVVVTTDLSGFQQAMPGHPIDVSLLEHLPANLQVERIPFERKKSLKIGKFREWCRIYFSLVEDIAEQWWPSLDAAMPELLEKHRPVALYVSLPPFCMAPLGCKIAREYNLPLLLDFRDAWSQWRISPYGSLLHYWLTRRMERQCLRAADRLVCTSNQTRADFLRVHPEVKGDKIQVITNGYDQAIEDWTLKPKQGEEEFVIGYVGSFYYTPQARDSMMRPWWRKRPNRMIQFAPRTEDWLYRSPLFFFRAVAILLEKHPEYRNKLRIRFAGQKPEWIDAQVSECGLTDVVEFVGRLDHPSVIKFQKECDALLVTSSKIIGGLDYSIAGKTFEYFSIRKPIIGFVAEGSQKELLGKSGMALLCDPDNPDLGAHQLSALIDGAIHFQPNAEFLYSLHRRELTRRLALIIKSITSSTVS